MRTKWARDLRINDLGVLLSVASWFCRAIRGACAVGGFGWFRLDSLDSTDGVYQFGGPHTQRARQRYESQQANVGFPSLHQADVVPVQFGNLGQLLLGQSALEAEFAQALSKEGERI